MRRLRKAICLKEPKLWETTNLGFCISLVLRDHFHKTAFA